MALNFVVLLLLENSNWGTPIVKRNNWWAIYTNEIKS